MIKAIIFDLDGTLIRLPIRYELLINNLKKFFNTTDELKPLISSVVEKSNGDKTKLKNAFDLICKEELTASENFEIITDATQVLDYFKSNNYTLGLVTMQCKPAVEKILSVMKVPNYFSRIITRDENYDRFEQIKTMIDEFNILPQEVLVVGDRIHDAESGHKVGCKVALVHENKLHHNPETLVFKKISELKNLEI